MKENSKNLEIIRIKEEYKRRDNKIPQDFYSLKHPANLYFYIQRFRYLIKFLKKENLFPLEDKLILDIGCGCGDWLVDFLKLGAEQKNLYGIDLLDTKIKVAKERLPFANLIVEDASTLPYKDNNFDIVLQATVFTSILDYNLKKAIAKEMLRVLKPTGIIIWYDFLYNNPFNKNVKGIKKKEISSLFLNCKIKLTKITLAPPIARILANYSYLACYLLENLKFLNTHYFGLIKKQDGKYK
ncbi:MAG: class I SAM-dependent methyltransferase [Candidatus Omnitrophica bacterium]|nr:class I SAM-dependent methyltransferase [Candidatus Omnitrophota bacterium]